MNKTTHSRGRRLRALGGGGPIDGRTRFASGFRFRTPDPSAYGRQAVPRRARDVEARLTRSPTARPPRRRSTPAPASRRWMRRSSRRRRPSTAWRGRGARAAAGGPPAGDDHAALPMDVSAAGEPPASPRLQAVEEDALRDLKEKMKISPPFGASSPAGCSPRRRRRAAAQFESDDEEERPRTADADTAPSLRSASPSQPSATRPRRRRRRRPTSSSRRRSRLRVGRNVSKVLPPVGGDTDLRPSMRPCAAGLFWPVWHLERRCQSTPVEREKATTAALSNSETMVIASNRTRE